MFFVFHGANHVLGGICLSHGWHPCDSITAVRYRDQIRQPHVLPLTSYRQHSLTFQQDNARPHVASICCNFLTAWHFLLSIVVLALPILCYQFIFKDTLNDAV